MKFIGNTEELLKSKDIKSTEQLTYIGTERYNGRKYRYIFRCNICIRDPELNGDALFYTYKPDVTSLSDKVLFCGCAKRVTWTEQQALVKSQRSANNAGHIFEGLVGSYINSDTRCNLRCKVCNYSWTLKVSMLWSSERGCIKCRDVKGMAAARKFNTKPDEVMINSFIESGAFDANTIFYRIPRTTKRGQCVYWKVVCSSCGDTYESQQGHLQKGKTGCSCSFHRQTQAYINIMYDEDNPVALKFGISKNSQNRLRQHNYNSQYRHELFAIYEYSTVSECKAAERKCKDVIPRGLVEMDLSESGWSEISYISHLDDVMRIFSSMGGQRIL